MELQAQKINNDRETLSRNEEKLMTEYSDKINNKALTIKKVSDSSNSDSTSEAEYVNLTAEEVYNAGYKLQVDGKTYDKASELPDKYKNAKGEGEDHNILQYGIMNGTVKLIKNGKETSYAAESNIKEDYDSSDDTAAKTKYDAEMKKVQRKDKALELQLDQIETRHKAYETEIESVQKVINNNIENSFNAFNQG